MAVALAFSMMLLESACALIGKPKTIAAAPPAPQPKPVAAKPAAPPEPLSVPQTNVQLPPAQPIDPGALEPPKPDTPAPAPPAARPPRRTPPATKPETPAPAATAPVPTPAETPVEPVQEVLSADERKRLLDSAHSRKADIHRLLTQIKSHRLNADGNRDVKRIQSLVSQSDTAEKRGDMRQADALAERALIIAQELNGGK